MWWGDSFVSPRVCITLGLTSWGMKKGACRPSMSLFCDKCVPVHFRITFVHKNYIKLWLQREPSYLFGTEGINYRGRWNSWSVVQRTHLFLHYIIINFFMPSHIFFSECSGSLCSLNQLFMGLTCIWKQHSLLWCVTEGHGTELPTSLTSLLKVKYIVFCKSV